MNTGNDFLNRFIQMRQTIPAKVTPDKKPSKEHKKSEKDLKIIQKEKDSSMITLRTILEDTPPWKEVQDFYRVMCDELNNETD